MDWDWLRDEIAHVRASQGDLAQAQIEMKGDLREHMRRTEVAEKRLDVLTEEFRPVREHVLALRVLWRWVLWAGALAGVTVGVAKALDLLP
jgi:hypothetical protein